jgi:hypothetical protein
MRCPPNWFIQGEGKLVGEIILYLNGNCKTIHAAASGTGFGELHRGQPLAMIETYHEIGVREFLPSSIPNVSCRSDLIGSV